MYIGPQQWNCIDTWNSFQYKTTTLRFPIANTIAANVLAKQLAMTSPVKLLTRSVHNANNANKDTTTDNKL